MSASTDSPDADIEETNQRLTEGLSICRSVVNDYRAMILGEETPADYASGESAHHPAKGPPG
jgi:hypothetical protein